MDINKDVDHGFFIMGHTHKTDFSDLTQLDTKGSGNPSMV